MTTPSKDNRPSTGNAKTPSNRKLSSADEAISAPDNTLDTTQPTAAPPDDQRGDIVLPDDHPAVSSWYDDPRPERYKVGKGNPPLHSRFKTGQSGNPRGRRRVAQPPPATLMSLIGKTLYEDIANLMRSPLSDLTVSANDIAVLALAKQIVSDAIKREGRSRTMVIDHFMEPQRGSDRYKERDHEAYEAERLSDMVKAIIDPHMTDEKLDAMLDRLKSEAAYTEFESESPVGELPPLPLPPRPRVKRKLR